MTSRWLPLLLLSVLPLVSVASGVRVDRMDGDAGRVGIRGEWPDACVPRVVTWASRSEGVDVLVGGTDADCAPGAHPFELQVSLGDLFSPAPTEDMVRTLRVFAEHGEGKRDDVPALVGFRLIGGSQPALPESGFWWPREDGASGNVVSLEVQGDQLGVALLGHDSRGAPQWYFGTATLRGRIAHAELVRVEGRSLFGGVAASPRAHPELAVDLAFQTSTRATLWLSRRTDDGEIEVVATPFERRGFDSLPQRQTWLGDWLLAGGEGLPATLTFTDSSADGRGHLRFAAVDAGFVLECDALEPDVNAAAQHCELRDLLGETHVRFKHVGFDRLDGRDAEGRVVVLLRPR